MSEDAPKATEDIADRAQETLAYATTAGPAVGSRRVLWIGVIVVAVLGFALLVEWGLDCGRAWETCKLCGAQSDVHHLRLFGIGGKYGRRVDEGVIAKFIQRHQGQPCVHDWELADGSWGALIARAHGSGGGLGRTRLRILEMFPALDEILEERFQADPTFLSRLKEAVQSPSEAGSENLFDEIRDEAFRRTQTSRTSEEP